MFAWFGNFLPSGFKLIGYGCRSCYLGVQDFSLWGEVAFGYIPRAQ